MHGMGLPLRVGNGSGGSHDGLPQYLAAKYASRAEKVNALAKKRVVIKGGQLELFCQGSKCLIHCRVVNEIRNAGSVAGNVKYVDRYV